jgi:hypothetical protein
MSELGKIARQRAARLAQEAALAADPPFTTYWNLNRPKAEVHRRGCRHYKQHGGQHKYDQGGWHAHPNYVHARAWAENTGLPVKDCPDCRPELAAHALVEIGTLGELGPNSADWG